MHKIPEGYVSKTSLRETEVAIKLIKDFFEKSLSSKLNLTRVSAPLFVVPETGLNDNLNGIENPVSFQGKGTDNNKLEIVHSLAKWKRAALKRYEFLQNEGLYTDMNAIRIDEELDNLHSIYVDQWDWEKVITKEDRNIETLKKTVGYIYTALLETEDFLGQTFPNFDKKLPNDITFITSQELLDKYPNLSSKERETAFAKEHRAIFIMNIGDVLSNGEKHDGRAPDYDDWGLNGDIILYHELLDCAFEISSMGIRVDKESLEKQLKKAGKDDMKNLPFHNDVLNEKLPLTIGGGIGQSRLCMYFMDKVHIGEVQVSYWDEEVYKQMEEHGIDIL